MKDEITQQTTSRQVDEIFQNIKNMPTVIAYVPIQHANQIYAPEIALQKGTLFPDLDKPFLAYRGGGWFNG